LPTVGACIPHFPGHLLLGSGIWTFFYEMTVQSLGSLLGRGDLIRKIRISCWIIVLSSIISALSHLVLNLIVVAFFMVINHVGLSASILLLPFILLEVYLLALGLSLFLSAIFVKFRDINYIWEVILQAGFYITPILYPLSRITNLELQKLILINPMAQSIQDARYVAITKQTITPYSIFEGGWYKFVPFMIVGILLVGGLVYFRSQSKYFAENI